MLAACGQRQPAPGAAPAPGRAPAQSSFLALDRDPAQCRAALDRLGTRASLMPGRQGPAGCGYAWAVLRTPASTGPRWLGEPPATSCSVAAALSWWEQSVVLPAARRHLGETVAAIRHMGSYGCRTIGNRQGGQPSEHAKANAIDIAGFRLASGREISVLKDWNGSARDRAFLRDVRNGACPLFGTVLSPDYNAAHADHLHFDQMPRSTGFCR
ncbi:extensin family protein [Sandaracinobacter sp. RS1-74]|uniref:extensin-like domain-containing protein n=1 Tax=Sandaracinobacteroides sayramensis TaxID=2913411 RepID=UPI001EDAC87E|nr:extensin family protein [Sandaracinobacteroides sayramensis]MCG2840379.1 extensin family protein [Sandaracinobacteroides sayramensis]